VWQLRRARLPIRDLIVSNCSGSCFEFSVRCARANRGRFPAISGDGPRIVAGPISRNRILMERDLSSKALLLFILMPSGACCSVALAMLFYLPQPWSAEATYFFDVLGALVMAGFVKLMVLVSSLEAKKSLKKADPADSAPNQCEK